jgi:hypothetical protein
VEEVAMRGLDRQLYRLVLALSLGVGFVGLAAQPQSPRVAIREKSAPIILAAALESVPAPASAYVDARVDQCSLNPRDYADDKPIGAKADKAAKKRRVVVCG